MPSVVLRQIGRDLVPAVKRALGVIVDVAVKGRARREAAGTGDGRGARRSPGYCLPTTVDPFAG
jgi:hypothetical protein